MSGRCEQVTEAGDIALVRNRWELRGQQPDGQPVESGGLSMVVLRRRADGTWGVVIDDPWGS
jgi:ketosteroid isomerase-like protein